MPLRRTTLPATGAMIAVCAAVFLFAPSRAARDLPTPQVVAASPTMGRLVVDLVDGTTAAERDALGAELGLVLDWAHPDSADEALAVADVAQLDLYVAKLTGHPLVEVVEPSMTMHSMGFPYSPPDDPLFERQWHLRAMGAPAGWRLTPQGAGVIVAVIDTGVAMVDDLDPQSFVPGASFVPGVSSSVDDQGHGTHVAGTIAQQTNNGIGTAGVAPRAKIMPVKVLSASGGGQSEWIATGIDWAADNGAQVINLSLGGGYSEVIHTAIRKARARGVLVVAAAGNNGRRGVSWPGALEETIGVSAVGPNDTLAPYSSWGPGVDITAPGGDLRQPNGGVLQATIGGPSGQQYAAYQGTSMAAPHVAGAAAVLLSTGLSPDAVEDLLLKSARGDGFTERFGHGRLDLEAALAHGFDRRGPIRFALAAVIALLIGQIAGTSVRFRIAGAALAGLVAGGGFVLSWLPMSGGLLGALASQPLLHWPTALGFAWLGASPLWLSAILPVGASFLFGVTRVGRVVFYGLCVGVGAHLLYGAATSTLAPWGMPFGLGPLWLTANATACGLMAMALAGIDHLEERS